MEELWETVYKYLKDANKRDWRIILVGTSRQNWDQRVDIKKRIVQIDTQWQSPCKQEIVF